MRMNQCLEHSKDFVKISRQKCSTYFDESSAQDDKESHVVVARMEKEHPWIQKEQAIFNAI